MVASTVTGPTGSVVAVRRDDRGVSIPCRLPWWLHPVAVVLLVPAATAVVSVVIPPSAFVALWRTRKFLDSGTGALLLLGLLAMVLGLVLGSSAALGRHEFVIRISSDQLAVLKRCYQVFLVLTVVGYALWIGIGVVNGVGVRQLLLVLGQHRGAIGNLKDSARPIGGLTTFVQLGPLCVALGHLLHLCGDVGRWYRVVFLLAAFRSFFYAERLALIEVVVPVVLLYAATHTGGRGWRSRIVDIGPLLAGPVLWLFFSVFEFFRTWVVQRFAAHEGFVSYVSTRLVGYYATAYNNSALFDASLARLPSDVPPYMTFPFLWNAPVLGGLLGSPSFMGLRPDDWVDFVLYSRASVQFTNKGSFLIAHGELGTVGMVVLFVLLGVAMGMLYSRVMAGGTAALVAYAVLLVGLLELPRILYWTEGRATPQILGCAVVWYLLKDRERRTAPA